MFRDLERKAVFEPIASFVQQMRNMRAHLKQSNELRYQYQKESWFVDTTQIYYDAVVSLALRSRPSNSNQRDSNAFRSTSRTTYSPLRSPRSALMSKT